MGCVFGQYPVDYDLGDKFRTREEAAARVARRQRSFSGSITEMYGARYITSQRFTRQHFFGEENRKNNKILTLNLKNSNFHQIIIHFQLFFLFKSFTELFCPSNLVNLGFKCQN